MKNRRDLIIIVGLFGALILFVAFGPKGQSDDGGPDIPTTHSSRQGGALGLYNWADALGFDTTRLEYRSFELSGSDSALVVLNPSESFTEQQIDDTLEWVDNGGTLIFADDSSILFGGSRSLLERLQVQREVYSDTQLLERAPVAQPFLDQPPFESALVNTGYVLAPKENDYVKLVGSPTSTILAGIQHGEGYVYLSSAAYPFSNEGLRDPGNAALVLNLLRRVPAGGRVVFDEYHHGYFTAPSTTSILLSNPWGWAATYAMVATALYLILSGRRFGRPVPLREEVARRSSAEYVESMADLFQRGGKRSFVLKHYHDAFKRRLARPYGINPQLDDATFVRELTRFREVDEPALNELLTRLRNPKISEQELVHVAAAAEQAVSTQHLSK